MHKTSGDCFLLLSSFLGCTLHLLRWSQESTCVTLSIIVMKIAWGSVSPNKWSQVARKRAKSTRSLVNEKERGKEERLKRPSNCVLLTGTNLFGRPLVNTQQYLSSRNVDDYPATITALMNLRRILVSYSECWSGRKTPDVWVKQLSPQQEKFLCVCVCLLFFPSPVKRERNELRFLLSEPSRWESIWV